MLFIKPLTGYCKFSVEFYKTCLEKAHLPTFRRCCVYKVKHIFIVYLLHTGLPVLFLVDPLSFICVLCAVEICVKVSVERSDH